MVRVLRREAAKRDLVALWVWYAEEAGIETADMFLAHAESALQMLALQPQCGAPLRVKLPSLQGVRQFRVSPEFRAILLFYLPTTDGIELIRVIHGSRDLAALFSE